MLERRLGSRTSFHAAADDPDRDSVSAARDRNLPIGLLPPGQRQYGDRQWPCGRLRPDRPGFHPPGIFPPAPLGCRDKGYDGLASGGSNLGPTSQKLVDRVKASVADFRKQNPDYHGAIPADIVTTSGSGLDPHISVAAAEAQADRVAHARGVPPDRIRTLIAALTEGPDLGLLGEPRVNVLRLNLALDGQVPK